MKNAILQSALEINDGFNMKLFMSGENLIYLAYKMVQHVIIHHCLSTMFHMNSRSHWHSTILQTNTMIVTRYKNFDSMSNRPMTHVCQMLTTKLRVQNNWKQSHCLRNYHNYYNYNNIL